MTMIAFATNHGALTVVGDLLITGDQKPSQFVLPAISEDIIDYLSDDNGGYPIYLIQKVYILKKNVCAIFAGNLSTIKPFLEDLALFCRIHDEINETNLSKFLKDYQSKEPTNSVSFMILIANKEGEIMQLNQVKFGSWRRAQSPLIGDVLAAGSGAIDFIEAITAKGDVLHSSFEPGSNERAIQTVLIILSQLLAKERAVLSTVKKHWGAGFEVVYAANCEFFKLDDITYIIHQGQFDKHGNIAPPIPAIILHYKYHGNVLVITAIAPQKGETAATDDQIVTRYTRYRVGQFIVESMIPDEKYDSKKITEISSFTSHLNAMGYIIETGSGGYYLPSSFHYGPEMTVEYKHKESVTITMKRELNDILSEAAKKIFPSLH